MTLTKIYWLDHFSDSRWLNEKEIEEWVEKELQPCITVGFLVKETPKYIVLASSWNGKDWGSPDVILKSCIVKREKLDG